jgi:uncharacterized membrane protein
MIEKLLQDNGFFLLAVVGFAVIKGTLLKFLFEDSSITFSLIEFLLFWYRTKQSFLGFEE